MCYPINFLNDNAEKNLEQTGRDSLDNVRKTLNMFLNSDSLTVKELLSDSDMNSDILDQIEEEKAEKSLSDEDNFNELSTYLQDDIRYNIKRFDEYGLSFDYVKPKTYRQTTSVISCHTVDLQRRYDSMMMVLLNTYTLIGFVE